MADKNEQAVQRARELAQRAYEAQKLFANYSQDKVDRIVESMAKAGYEHAARLAKLAVEETGIGRESDKIIKNQFASKNLYESIKDTKTVGVLNRDEARKIVEIAAPAGVIVAIILNGYFQIHDLAEGEKLRCHVPASARYQGMRGDGPHHGGRGGARRRAQGADPVP